MKYVFDTILWWLGIYDDYYMGEGLAPVLEERIPDPKDIPPSLSANIADTHRRNYNTLKANKKARREGKTINCAVCDTAFKVPKTSRNKGFCSDECRKRHELDKFTV